MKLCIAMLKHIFFVICKFLRCFILFCSPLTNTLFCFRFFHQFIILNSHCNYFKSYWWNDLYIHRFSQNFNVSTPTLDLLLWNYISNFLILILMIELSTGFDAPWWPTAGDLHKPTRWKKFKQSCLDRWKFPVISK